MKKLLLVSVGLLTIASSGASLRRLPELTIMEGSSLEFSSDVAVGLRSSNTAIASVTSPNDGKALVMGIKIGSAEIAYSDVRGPYAIRPVMVVPTYWDTLKAFFEDDPEITIMVSGDKVIVSGRTANPETLRHVEESKAFDTSRIVTHVTYAMPAIAELVSEYLTRIGHKNVKVSVVGNEICLSGALYDKAAIATVAKRAETFLKDFPGVTVNADALQMRKQKIVLKVEMVEYDVGKARNLGIRGPDQITANGNFSYSWNSNRTNTDAGEVGSGVSRFSTSNYSSSGGINNVQARVNLLKQNTAAKTLYETTLSTQSGEGAEFQNGGTLHRNTQGTFSNGDLKQIEYGFLVKATPVIVDDDLVSLELDLENKTRPPSLIRESDIDIPCYKTKSRYLVRPGETIALSGFNRTGENVSKEGVPFLSHIPLIGPWLFGNRNVGESKTEILLLVTINWALEDEGGEAVSRGEELKARSVDIEMP